jgi:hypothetical protein
VTDWLSWFCRLVPDFRLPFRPPLG